MIDACHANGMYAMSYDLLYGAYGDYRTDGSGVSSDWELLTSPGGNQWALGLPAAWANGSGAIVMFNPGNTAWQSYLFGRQNDMFAAYAFDGWHVDQLGNDGLMYDIYGNSVDVWTTFAGFLNNAKTATGKRIDFNNVSTYGMYSVCSQTADDDVYVECWPFGGQTTYNDLKAVIDDGLAWGNGKPVVLAAYMDQNLTSGTFNAPGVLLCDAAIFASGGTHIELGDGGHMLYNGIFSDQAVALSSSLANTLVGYYNFLYNYQNYLYGGYANSANPVSLSVPSASMATPDEVWAFAKVLGNTTMLNLINLVGESDIDWEDADGTYPPPAPQANVTAKYYYGPVTPGSVQIASPDNGGAISSLGFTTGSDSGGNYVSFIVPSLVYWDIIIISPAPPTILSASPLPAGALGSAYSETLSSSGGSGMGYSYTLTSGTLPPGLALSSAGVLSGTLSTLGSWSFTIGVTDSAGTSGANAAFSIAANYPALSVTTSSLAVGALGASYSQALGASGGTGTAYSWSIPGGSTLTAGLTLSGPGVLSGMPTQVGEFSFTVQVTDGGNNTATASLSLPVASPIVSWRYAQFGADANVSSIGGDTATPAGDGIANLMKYSLNLNPWTNGVAGLPVASITKDGSNSYLSLVYTQVITATDITYTPEVSGDMKTWNFGSGYVAPVSVTNNPDGLTETVVVRDTMPMSSASQRFIRLQVTGP